MCTYLHNEHNRPESTDIKWILAGSMLISNKGVVNQSLPEDFVEIITLTVLWWRCSLFFFHRRRNPLLTTECGDTWHVVSLTLGHPLSKPFRIVLFWDQTALTSMSDHLHKEQRRTWADMTTISFNLSWQQRKVSVWINSVSITACAWGDIILGDSRFITLDHVQTSSKSALSFCTSHTVLAVGWRLCSALHGSRHESR